MARFKNYNFSQGFLSLISLLIILAIIIVLIFGLYFGFNKIRFSNSDQPGQSGQFSPQEAIQKAKDVKDLLESQQESLE
ncbi:hypothetical protein AMJ48_02805 [Parcubacteria bacterium DG_74_1]|nr:MAG: hypothetical protein AMJ48_02805 [Parcubacteria bacterium DG_74_1]